MIDADKSHMLASHQKNQNNDKIIHYLHSNSSQVYKMRNLQVGL